MKKLWTKFKVALGFRAPDEPSRKELRCAIKDVVAEGIRHSSDICEKTMEITGDIPPVPHGAHG